MASAARCPAAMASMTVAGPLTASPPAKTSGMIGLRRVAIDHQGAPTGHLETRFRKILGFGLLADGRNEGIAGYDEFRAFDGDRSPAATRIGCPQFGADAFQAGNLAVCRRRICTGAER